MKSQKKVPDTPRRPKLVGWRRWAFPAATAILVPLLLLGALEIGLRVADYGFDPSFFQPNGARAELTSNPRYGWRFFPPAIAREPAIFTFPREKAEGTYRIFVLGGSAAYGVPRPGLSFARLLEAMLEEAFPETRFEVISTAMTAINSHVVREIADESAAYDPDLFLVYMGNNEVVGPYGPGTVFADASESLAAIRWSIRARATRTGQLMARLLGKGRDRGPALDQWRGLEMFLDRQISRDDPRLETMLSHLRANLVAIAESGEAAGADVLVSTVGVNLADCPPFASRHGEGFDEGSQPAWDEAFQAGRDAYQAGEFEASVAAFEKAVELDPDHAEAQYRLARALLVLGEHARASDALERALDLDQLRFRAESRINRQIREFAGSGVSQGLALVDGAAALASAPETANGITGAGLFHEHVHLNTHGNYRLAEAFFAPVSQRVAAKLSLDLPGEVPSFETATARLALSPWDEFEASVEILQMTSKAPFTAQAGHESRQAVRRGEINQWRGYAAANGAASRQVFSAAVKQQPDDLALRERYAMLLEAQGSPVEAAEQWSELVSRVGDVARWHTRWGFALLDQGENEQAQSRMRRALEIAPHSPIARNNLALVLQRSGDLAQARDLLEGILAEAPDSVEARLNLAKNWLLAEDYDRAFEEYQQALERHPTLADAAFGLGLVAEARRNHPEAIEYYRQALTLDPGLAKAHNNIGYVLEKEGQLDEALAAYNSALKIDPYHATSLFNAADIFLRKGEVENAGRAYEAALRLSPGNVQARYNLAMAYQMAGAERPAAEQLGLVIQTSPNFIQALHNLAWILGTTRDGELRDTANAVAFATRAAQLSGAADPQILDTLAVCFAADGKMDQALETLEAGMRAARLKGNSQLETALRARKLEFESAQGQ